MGTSILYYHKTQSVKSKFICLFFRLINLKKKLGKANFSSVYLKKANVPKPPTKFLKGIHVSESIVNNQKVFTLTPLGIKPKKHILFFHGGAFVINFTLVHWKFITNLVKHANIAVIAVDYPLLPNFSYKERISMGEVVYKDLLKKTTSDNIILMGDSAGGNIGLALAQKLESDGFAQPAQIILLSPWLDVSMCNPKIAEVNKHDPLLPYGDDKLAKLHAGDKDLKYFLVSPLYGPLKRLGKISLFTGTYDILNPDARQLKLRAKAEGLDINYFEYQGMFHDWILFPLPEAKIAFDQILQLLK